MLQMQLCVHFWLACGMTDSSIWRLQQPDLIRQTYFCPRQQLALQYDGLATFILNACVVQVAATPLLFWVVRHAWEDFGGFAPRQRSLITA